MKKILIIGLAQFGSNTAIYYYCKYLRDSFDITYFGFGDNSSNVKLPNKLPNIKYKNVSRKGNKAIRSVRLIFSIIKEARKDYDIIITTYFYGVILIRIFSPSKDAILDIRTGSISTKKFIRKINNYLIRLQAIFFKRLSIISESLSSKFRIPKIKRHILPVGADIISNSVKTFDELNILYVGTHLNRNIEHTIFGFNKFYKEYGSVLNMKYTIVGSGPIRENKNLLQLVKKNGLENVINVLGYIHHTNLKDCFDSCNIGVAYVPITDYYDCQPVTKVFEYLLSGIPVIATATYENKKVINSSNGVLIKDTAEGFYNGLKNMLNLISHYKSATIRTNSMDHSWKHIVQNNLKRYLENILSKRAFDQYDL